MIYALIMEGSDIWTNPDSKEVGDGHSRSYIYGKYSKGDGLNEMLDKLDYLSTYEERTIKWRRAFICSFISSLLIILLTFESFPKGKNYFIMIFISFIIFLESFYLYDYHYNRYPVNFTKQILNKLKSKLKTKRENKLDVLTGIKVKDCN